MKCLLNFACFHCVKYFLTVRHLCLQSFVQQSMILP